MSNLKNVEEYLLKNYEFKFNVVLNRTYYRKVGDIDKEFRLLDDYALNSLYRELQNSKNEIGKRQLNILLESSFVPRSNPIEEYFNGLPEWDGQTDYIDEFLNSVKTTDDKNFRWAFKKWFVAMIACAIEVKITNHCAIIFIGAQGIGKTTWFFSLLPLSLSSYFYSGRINPNNKDTLLQLSECIIINMEEIGAFSKSQTEAFKEIITKNNIRERRAYGVFSENYIRRASFVGSTNSKFVLKDITGNRRFLVFETTGFKSTSPYDLDKIYAQGINLYKNGFRYWFNPTDIKSVNQINEKYRQISDEEQYLMKHFRKTTRKDKEYLKLNATEIINKISKKEKDNFSFKLSSIEMGKTLNSNGFIYRNKQYYLVEKT